MRQGTSERPAINTHVLRGVRLGIIGAGNMGQALISGALAAGVSGSRLLVVEADAAKRRRLVRRARVTPSTIERVAAACDAIILAVKPQDMAPVLERLSQSLTQRPPIRQPLIISIAAGLTIASLQRALGGPPLIRVMPNLPATVGSGISAMTAGRWATRAHRALAKAIFESVGEVVELPERVFDIVTAISGSGPAYYFLIFQALRDAGMEAGLPKWVAQRLAIQTAIGSGMLAKQSTDELEAMLTRVASKQGTTEAALKVFARRGLARMMREGVHAARRRSQELTRCLS